MFLKASMLPRLRYLYDSPSMGMSWVFGQCLLSWSTVPVCSSSFCWWSDRSQGMCPLQLISANSQCLLQREAKPNQVVFLDCKMLSWLTLASMEHNQVSRDLLMECELRAHSSAKFLWGGNVLLWKKAKFPQSCLKALSPSLSVSGACFPCSVHGGCFATKTNLITHPHTAQAGLLLRRRFAEPYR